MKFEDFFKLKSFWILTGGIVGLIVILSVFKVGMIIGIRKADFSCRWSDNYHRNFAGPRGGFMMNFQDQDFIEASGSFGKIIRIDGNILILVGRNNIEKSVLISEKTIIKRFQDDLKVSDLKIDDQIAVIGEPNEAGQIVAKLVRVFPARDPGFIPIPREWKR